MPTLIYIIVLFLISCGTSSTYYGKINYIELKKKDKSKPEKNFDIWFGVYGCILPEHSAEVKVNGLMGNLFDKARKSEDSIILDDNVIFYRDQCGKIKGIYND